MTYNTSLKCTARFIRIYTDTLRNGYGDDTYADIVFDIIDTNSDAGHSVQFDSENTNYIKLGANKHYVILGMIHQADDVRGEVIAVDTSGNTLTEADGFFSIKRHYGSALSASHSALSGVSASNLNQDSSKNYTFKIIKSTGNSTFSFKFRGYAQTAENLPTDSQLVIIEMSE